MISRHARHARYVMTRSEHAPRSLTEALLRKASINAKQTQENFSPEVSKICLPSPALREGGWVGRSVGTKGKVADKYGDAIMCCQEIPGDSWRKRHDVVKQHLYLEAALSKVPADCEVFGLFGDLLPAALQEEDGELQ